MIRRALLALALLAVPAVALAEETRPPLAPDVIAAAALPHERWGRVLWADDGRVYAAKYSGTGTLEPGTIALLINDYEVLDTLEVAWSRDAITAFRMGVGAEQRLNGMLPSYMYRTFIALLPGHGGVAPPAHGKLRVPIATAVGTLDPLYLTGLAEKQLASQMFAGLVRLGPSLRPDTSLALRWSAEGTTWRFHLRPDATFPGDRPIRAADVAASLERALAPRNGAPRVDGLAAAIEGGAAFRAGRIKSLAGVRVLDSLTIAITAAGPRARLIEELATPAAFVVPRGTPPRAMTERELLSAQSGPFRLTGVTDRAVTLLASPGRRGGPASLDFVRVEGPAEAAMELELGRIDLAALPEPVARRFLQLERDRPGEISVEELSTYYVGFDTRRTFVSNVEHRRALAGLIDRALAVRVLAAGRARPAQGLLPPAFRVAAPPESMWAMPRAEAERAARGGFGGKAPALSLWVPTGSEIGLRMVEYVASAWRRAGVQVTIVERPWPEFQKGVADGKADAFYLSWFADGPDPIAFLASMVESTRRGEGGNRTHYASAAVDAALAEARRAATDREMNFHLEAAQLAALRDAPIVPFFHSVNVTLVRPGVTGLVLDPLGAPRYDRVEVR